MLSRVDRFWIRFILRLSFGLFFLLAAINIFSAGGPTDDGYEWFASNLSKPFASSWLGDVTEALPGEIPREAPAYYFLLALPFIFAALSLPILLGIFLKPALRIAAILFVFLGLGKYITTSTDLTTTANDFFFAFLICVGLYFLGEEKSLGAETCQRRQPAGDAGAGADSPL